MPHLPRGRQRGARGLRPRREADARSARRGLGACNEGEHDLRERFALVLLEEVAPAGDWRLDLRLGFMTLGYRFLPAALGWQQVDTHHLTLGFGIF